MPTKRILSPEEITYLKKHFRNRKNADLARKLGISETALHRFARAFGLKKTPQFVHKTQDEAARKAKASHLLNGTYPPKGFAIPNREKGQFRKGVPLVKHIGARKERQRQEKSAASRRETVKRERARALIGLPQKTKIRLSKEPKAKTALRCNLRKRGYIIARGSNVAYYDENTQRSLNIENRKRGDKHYFYFEFLPMEKN